MGKKKGKALPPNTQSKQPYIEDDDMALTLAHKPGSKGKGQLDCHPLIQSAFSELSEGHVEILARRIAFLSTVERKKVKKELTDSEVECENFIELVLKRCEEKANTTLSKDDLEDGKTQCLSNYEQMFDEMYSRAEKLANELEKDPQIARARNNRDEINRILNATKRGASHYEILGLKSTANDRDIISAVRKRSMMVHPDRNDDEDAEACFKAIQAAGDTLRDKQSRRDYDVKTKNAPNKDNSPDSFGEDFHISAFDADASSDDEEPTHPQHPPPYELARKAHEKMQPAIENFFRLDKQDIHAGSVKHIMKCNQALEKQNQRENLAPELYQFSQQMLTLLRTKQVTIIQKAEKGQVSHEQLQKEVEAFRDDFVKSGRQSVHQWPEGWADLAVDPLVAELKEKGITVTIQKTAEEQPDEKMSEDEEPEEDVIMSEARGASASKAVTSQHFEPGQSALGKILGYAPQTRYFRIQKQEIIQSFKFFVEVDGDNPLQLVTDGDIGHPASMAYHNLPDGQKNDVRNSAKKYNRDMPPEKFQGIRGVAYDPNRRHTYVWVRMADEAESSRASILTRSALRDWLTPRYADKCIEDFFISQGDTPPWAKEIEAQRNHLQLQYPLPTAGGLEVRGSREGQRTLNNPSSDNLEQLTARMDKLILFMVEDQKQRQEERKEMMRLLPAAQSN